MHTFVQFVADFGRRTVEEELRYAGSEACFEGEAHKEHCIRSWHRWGVLGSVDRRIASGYTASVSGIAPRRIGSRSALAGCSAVSGSTLDEEEISDVSLATFHLFDKDDLGNSQSGIQVAFRGCGGGAAADMAAEAAFEAAAAVFEAAAEAFEAAALAFAAAEAAALASRLRFWRLRLRRLRRLGLGLGRRLLLVMGRLRARQTGAPCDYLDRRNASYPGLTRLFRQGSCCSASQVTRASGVRRAAE